MSIAYTVDIETNGDYATLTWLSERGYDGNLLALSEMIEDRRYGCVLGLTEPQAWEFREYVDSDPDAFLTCCGSDALSKALLALWGEIV